MPLTRREAAAAVMGFGLASAGLGAGIGAVDWLRTNARSKQNGDVRAFGAKGDGRHDDGPAIQRAIDSGIGHLWFPAGRYRLGQPLRPRSGQSWRGDGWGNSVLIYGGSPRHAPFNMVHVANEVLTNFSITDLGFLGNRGGQLVPSATGQEGFALYLRGILRAITLNRCRFEHFGDGRNGGGGVVLGPAPGYEVQGLDHIAVENCSFTDNGNVPGLYISGGDKPSGNVRVHGNDFTGSIGATKVQNTIYVLGGGKQAILRHLDISHNRFDFTTPVDVAIEVNWAENFTIANNIMHFHATMPGSTAILIRDGSTVGMITGNVLSSSTDDPTLRGILALNFSHPGEITDLVVSANLISGIAGAISADRGVRGMMITGNRIVGRGVKDSFGIRVVDARNVRVLGNTVSAMNQGVIVGNGDDWDYAPHDVAIEHNYFSRCGGHGRALIGPVETVSSLTLGDMSIRHNSAVETLSGSPVIDPRLQVPDDRL